MRKYVDRIMHRLGYVRWDHVLQGEIEFTLGDQPFVNLTLPFGGQRVYGWVDNRVRY